MAAAPIKVFPRIAEALVIGQFRKDRPALTVDGALWPNDSFTQCRLTDRSVTLDEALRYRPAPEAAPAATEDTPAA